MAKKFFDILAPKSVTTVIKRERPVLASGKHYSSQGKKGKGWGLSVLLLVVFAALGSFLYFNLAKARVEIWPEKKSINLKTEVEAGLVQKTISGTWLDEEKESAREFNSSGAVEKKEFARGKIKVNNKSNNQITLIKNTRFLSDEGKQFHSLKEITVPAKGAVDGVEVESDGAGEEYNIGPSKFSVPNLRKYSSSLFYEIWAESQDSMTGGFSGQSPVVTEDDLKNAETELLEKLYAEGRDSLNKSALAQDYVLSDEALKQELIEKFTFAKAGQELKSFVYKARIKSSGLAFKKGDLEKFSRDFIYSQISADKKLVDKSLNLKYAIKEKNLEEGKIILSLEMSADIYSDMDIQALRNKIKGKSAADGNNFLGKEDGISKANIKLWPPFVRRVPKNDDKIEIELKLD